MVFTIISSILIIITIYSAYKEFRKNTSFIRNVYLSRPVDYIWSFIISLFMFFVIFYLSKINLPKILFFSWIDLLTDNKKGGNVIGLLFSGESAIVIFLFWILLCLSMPYLAKLEEERFRSNIITLKERIFTNFRFGILHMIMGVPFIFSLIIGFIGFIYSIIYVNEFKKNIHLGEEEANRISTFITTSIHTKYNFILITISALASIILCFRN